MLKGGKNSTITDVYNNILTVPANKFRLILCGTWEEIEYVTKSQYFYNNQDLRGKVGNSRTEKWTGHFELGINNPAGWASAPVKDLAVESKILPWKSSQSMD